MVTAPFRYGWTAVSFISENTGPMTNSVRNSAMPVSTVLGGDICMPSAFRVSDSTTMILVNEVASSSTAGATDSTVIARISVIDVLGLPLPTEMSTPPSTAGTVGAVGAVGAVGRGSDRAGGVAVINGGPSARAAT